MIKKILVLFLLIPFAGGFSIAQDFPEPMQPPRMVNDFTGFLEAGDASSLEQLLRDFNDRTSTQIYVVTVPVLHGYDKSDYTTRLAEKWGVGQKGRDNGVMILIKPKTAEERGEVFIAVGYGLEGVLTDLQANRIVDLELIPRFEEGDYYGGILKAVETVMKITGGEFTAEQYLKEAEGGGFGSIIGLIILIIIFIAIFGGRSRMNRHQNFGRSNLPFWLLLGLMSSGRSNGGSFGGFSSGGGFGGFGGGGGGSFGGGGAGGSW